MLADDARRGVARAETVDRTYSGHGGMEYQCVIVYTVISPSSSIAPTLRLQLESTVTRQPPAGCVAWLKSWIKRLDVRWDGEAVLGIRWGGGDGTAVVMMPMSSGEG